MKNLVNKMIEKANDKKQAKALIREMEPELTNREVSKRLREILKSQKSITHEPLVRACNEHD